MTLQREYADSLAEHTRKRPCYYQAGIPLYGRSKSGTLNKSTAKHGPPAQRRKKTSSAKDLDRDRELHRQAQATYWERNRMKLEGKAWEDRVGKNNDSQKRLAEETTEGKETTGATELKSTECNSMGMHRPTKIDRRGALRRVLIAMKRQMDALENKVARLEQLLGHAVELSDHSMDGSSSFLHTL
ncbi:hypothetical protein CPB84DRAFT_1744334 [Gymnopilus junonius]|uniref:Uncharacterized protein n=1 Tax=Gymnopilus junonius TaxID=109634 RepID=A0A9P5NVY6_GYMJU|nr:hypothetical protein CPB84DRAFT_1744334 [Gymnopilus junonius]